MSQGDASGSTPPSAGWPAPPTPSPRSASGQAALGLAVLSLAVSVLLVLGLVAAAALLTTGVISVGGSQASDPVTVTASADPSSSDSPTDGSYGTLNGRLSPAPKHGRAVSGDALMYSVQRLLNDGFGNVTALACPRVPRVAQGVVSVCHGEIDGDQWDVVVIFEDGRGDYTLDML